MKLKLTQEPNKLLHKKLKKIEAITDKIRKLAEDMKETMVEEKGVGLAANQIGKDLQIFVIDKNLAEENKVPDVYINPEITDLSKDTGTMDEGCLSIPGFWHSVSRSKKLHIKATDIEGRKIRFRARGFLARVLQHEYDHLQGKTIQMRAEEQKAK